MNMISIDEPIITILLAQKLSLILEAEISK